MGGRSEAETYRRKVAAVQRRGALRVACAYRTVSEAAVLVIAGAAPIDLLAFERAKLYDAKENFDNSTEAKNKNKKRDAPRVAEPMDVGGDRRWTERLIPNIDVWVSLGSTGDTDFFLTQLLTGQTGSSNAYLFKMVVSRPAHQHRRANTA
ncbi:uncharacterized protein LOC124360988 [Homalodisca vitripennis]|uniref:uncharacterized protein LOC124360988 n=1 Tax=Homalodisca vitripennis TaxID=197043 RepID=UPI001EE9F72E|nr:uncharacterized protein LOC124360988 [Homalodisca vitripennis]